MNVRTGFLCLLAIVLATACDAMARAEGPRTESPRADAAVENFLGAEMVDIIANANRVESFQLEPKMMPNAENTVQGYPVGLRGPDLTVDQIGRLRGLIFAESSYLFDRSKRCPFVADTSFVFHADEGRASVTLATACKLWGFAQGDDKPKIEDFDPAGAGIATLAAELFGVP